MLRRVLVVCGTTLLGLLMTSQALATPVAEKLDVEIWSEYMSDRVLLVEYSKFPANASLPIEAKFSLPKGALVNWAGELAGTGSSEDVQATPRINQKSDHVEVIFTLTKGREAQVEAVWPGVKTTGQTRKIVLDWVQRYPAKETRFGLRVPADSTAISSQPLFSYSGKSADKLQNYSTKPMALSVGQKQKLEITYSRTKSGQSITPNQTNPNKSKAPDQAAANYAAFTFVVIGAVIVFALYRYRAKMQPPDDGED